MMDKLLTVTEATQMYFGKKMGQRFYYRLFERGLIRGYKAGGRVLLSEASLDEYQAKCLNEPPAEKKQKSKPKRKLQTGYQVFHLPE